MAARSFGKWPPTLLFAPILCANVAGRPTSHRSPVPRIGEHEIGVFRQDLGRILIDHSPAAAGRSTMGCPEGGPPGYERSIDRIGSGPSACLMGCAGSLPRLQAASAFNSSSTSRSTSASDLCSSSAIHSAKDEQRSLAEVEREVLEELKALAA